MEFMAKIHFAKPRPAIDVQSGETLMQALLRAGLPVASSCNGDGICGKCKVQVTGGAENLSQINEREQLLRQRLPLPKDVRLSCQTFISDDVTLDTPYW